VAAQLGEGCPEELSGLADMLAGGALLIRTPASSAESQHQALEAAAAGDAVLQVGVLGRLRPLTGCSLATTAVFTLHPTSRPLLRAACLHLQNFCTPSDLCMDG
jgi:hypothetical protein